MKLALSLVAAALMAAPLAMADPGGGMGGGGSNNNGPSVTDRSSRDPQAAYQAGVAALNAQNWAEAIRQFRVVRRSAPNNGTVNYALGLAYSGAGDTDNARTSLERAVRADDVPPAAFLKLGQIYLQLNRRDDAVAQQTALNRALQACDASCGEARRIQLQAALTELTMALEANPAAADPATTGWNFPSVEEGRLAYADAVGLINQERFADALDALGRAEAAVGPHPDVLNYMGFASRKLGRFDAALGYYHQALAIDPNHLGATEYLGELYIQMGQMDRARSQLARLDRMCAYGCIQREELARWITTSAQ
jgi:tetratricopeptide (TPR) repeat protein